MHSKGKLMLSHKIAWMAWPKQSKNKKQTAITQNAEKKPIPNCSPAAGAEYRN
jgi:hypothetical protein